VTHARGAPTERAPAGSTRGQLAFIGRAEELEWLAARGNEARSLVGARLIGETGVGKTRLVHEFLDSAAAIGDVVVQAGPDPARAEVGGWALRQAIVQLAGLPTTGGSPRDWAAATPEARRGLADVFALEPSDQPARLTPEERRFAAAEALRWAVVRANERARGRRVLLAIDDLDQVDGASRNAFADSLSDPPLVPALLLASYSPPFDPGWPADVSTRVLGGLPVSQVAIALSRSRQPSLGLASDRTISPLYLEQLLRFQREDSANAPEGLADLIALRVERLPADSRRVLQAAAVWGDDADDTVLAGMVVVSGGLVRASHPLVREVTLAMIPAAVRRQLHGAALDAGDDRGLPLEVRAVHEYWGGTAFQALLLLEQVSAGASARGDLKGAVSALRRGLDLARRELFRGELDDPMRAVLIFSRKLGEALARAGRLSDAEGVLREALDVAGARGSDRAVVLGALAHVAHDREHREEARGYLREALELASGSGARELVTSLETLRRAIAQ
jgi:serine/threonine-protein kinase